MQLVFLFVFAFVVAPIAFAQDDGGWRTELLNPKAHMQDQNSEVDAEGLKRFGSQRELGLALKQKKLVPLPKSPGLRVDRRLPANRRFCLPLTRDFLLQLSTDFRGEFQQAALQVNSAVRPADIQARLFKHFRNGDYWGAAPASGEYASSHLAGSTFDLAKKGLSSEQQDWVAAYLAKLVTARRIHLINESACWHVMVCRDQCVIPDTPPSYVLIAPLHQESKIKKMLAEIGPGGQD